MTNDRLQEIRRIHNEGARAMSNAELEKRQLEDAPLMRQRGPLTIDEQDGMRNLWAAPNDAGQRTVEPKPPTMLARLLRWLRA